MRKQLNLFPVILLDWMFRESPYAARMTAAVAAIQGNLRKSDRRKKSLSFSFCTLLVCERRNAFTAQEVNGGERRGRGRSRDGGGGGVTLDSVVRVHACLASFVHLTRAGCSLPLLLLLIRIFLSSFFLLHSLQVIPTFLVVRLRHF